MAKDLAKKHDISFLEAMEVLKSQRQMEKHDQDAPINDFLAKEGLSIIDDMPDNILREDLWSRYKSYCNSSRAEVLSQARFERILIKLGAGLTRKGKTYYTFIQKKLILRSSR
jgi:hypothetical protein